MDFLKTSICTKMALNLKVKRAKDNLKMPRMERKLHEFTQATVFAILLKTYADLQQCIYIDPLTR